MSVGCRARQLRQPLNKQVGIPLGQEVGTNLGAAALTRSCPRPRGVRVCLNVPKAAGLAVLLPALVQCHLWLPRGMGSRPLSLAPSVTNTHALLSLLVCPLSCPGSFLPSAPAWVPSPSPLLAISGPSQTEAEVGEYHSSLCPLLAPRMSRGGEPSNTRSHICHFPTLPGSPWSPLPPDPYIWALGPEGGKDAWGSLELGGEGLTPSPPWGLPTLLSPDRARAPL